MHDDELETDEELVRELLAAQHGHLATLPLQRVESTGTSNAMYRLGDDMVVRLPLQPGSSAARDRELRWVPWLAPHLSVAVPLPIAVGEPTANFPERWIVYPWLAGEDAILAEIDELSAAQELATLLAELQAIDPSDGPRVPAAEGGRGVPLAERDTYTRRGIESADHLVDVDAVTAIWEDALAASALEPADEVWIHGDVASGNLLFVEGRLSAAIDWSQLAVGDPAADYLVAWEMFDHPGREHFREACSIDDATWRRSRGWALSTAIAAWPYYEHTNRFMAEQAERKIHALLADR